MKIEYSMSMYLHIFMLVLRACSSEGHNQTDLFLQQRVHVVHASVTPSESFLLVKKALASTLRAGGPPTPSPSCCQRALTY